MTGRVLRLVSVACLVPAALLAASLPAGALGPARTAATAASSEVDVVRASGTFEVALDPSTFRLQPVGNRCLLTVSGAATFSGSLQGTAALTTTAFEQASCDEVATNRPGTFADVFSSTGTFDGTVHGQPVTADIVYAGRTAAGGSIDATMRLTGDLTGVLQVEATLGIGGTYSGLLVLH